MGSFEGIVRCQEILPHESVTYWIDMVDLSSTTVPLKLSKSLSLDEVRPVATTPARSTASEECLGVPLIKSTGSEPWLSHGKQQLAVMATRTTGFVRRAFPREAATASMRGQFLFVDERRRTAYLGGSNRRHMSAALREPIRMPLRRETSGLRSSP